jgi:lysophospholipase L1-like esterase
LRDKESAIIPSSDRVLKFGGKPSFTIPPGALAISDPVDLDIPKLADLVISVYVPNDPGALSQHSLGLQTTYIVAGDATGNTALADATNTQSWYWISSVDVLAPANYALIVAFGDSITDGATSTPGADRSWPSFLAARLQANAATAHLAVVNQGISGNGVLSDIIGTNALARFDRDVLMQPGVKYVTILEGINDIGVSLGSGPFARPGSTPVTAEDLIAGYKQLIERAHARGLKVIGCTLTPYLGAAYASEKGETIRSAVNDWIRSGGAYDAVIDFDAVTRDAANPKQLRPSYNLTDHLHPNDAGYKAMADAIDVSIFADRPAAKR